MNIVLFVGLLFLVRYVLLRAGGAYLRRKYGKPKRKDHSKCNHGFTVVELIVALAIISGLITVFIGSLAVLNVVFHFIMKAW